MPSPVAGMGYPARMPSLLGLLPEDLVRELASLGVPCSVPEARRVQARVISEGADDPSPRRPVRRVLVDAIREHATWDRLQVSQRIADASDGAVLYRFTAADGAVLEAVRIPLEAPGRFTVCLSSQVGCAMACTFCATGQLGLTRNLTSAEIVSTFLTVRDEAPGRVTGAVFMGQGEPFHNYDAVIQAARVLCDPCGGRISAEAITISTVGLLGPLRRYTAEGHRFRLVVSLHSARSALRERLAPVAGRTAIEDLAAAIRAHAEASGDRVTIAFVLLGGVNTDPAEAAAIQALLGDVPLRVNLIDVNTDTGGFRRATDAERAGLFDALQILRAPIVRRYSVGKNERAACGMLAAGAVGSR